MGGEQIDLPLRGLASEGALDLVRRSVGSLDGVLSVEGGPSEYVVRITYDPAHVSPASIRHALHSVGAKGGA